MRPVEPYRNTDINEGTEIKLDLTHLDDNDVKFTPTAVSYRIDDLTNDREVLDWTSISTPTSTNTITITQTTNQLRSRAQPKELRQVTVNVTDSSGGVSQDTFYYTLIRIFAQDSQKI